MQLILDTKGLHLGRDGQVFVITAGERVQRISVGKVSSIAVTRNCTIGTDAIMLAVEREIPILLLDRLGRVMGRFWSPYFSSIATLRRKQVVFADSPLASAWVVEVLLLKIHNAEATLNGLKRRRQRLAGNIDEARWKMQENSRKLKLYADQPVHTARGQIMSAEGAAIRPYWKVVGEALPGIFHFDKRSRMPAQDPFNAALNYLYGMLYGVVEGAIFAAGLDPHLGLLHVDQHDKPTLAFDLIEPFRPWVDELLIHYAIDGELLANFFNATEEGVFLAREGKAVLIPAFNDLMQERVRWLEVEASRQNHIYRLAGLLAQRIRAFEEQPA